MGLCARIKTDNVLYDERIFIRETETGVPLPAAILPLPEGSRIDPNPGRSSVLVDVRECDLVTVEAKPSRIITGVRVTLGFEKNIAIVDRNGTVLHNLEYSFTRVFPVTLTKIVEGNQVISLGEFPRARCQIFEISATDKITLVDRSRFNDDALVTIKCKIVQEDQILVALCPSNLRTTASLTVG